MCSTGSAVALGGTVGPSRTTISAVADHPGVRRASPIRDAPGMPLVMESAGSFRDHLGEGARVLGAGRSRSKAAAAAGHALPSTTWLSLTGDQALHDKRARTLMVDVVMAMDGRSR